MRADSSARVPTSADRLDPPRASARPPAANWALAPVPTLLLAAKRARPLGMLRLLVAVARSPSKAPPLAPAEAPKDRPAPAPAPKPVPALAPKPAPAEAPKIGRAPPP